MFLSILQVFFSPPNKFVLVVHKFYSIVYSLHILLIPGVFHQFLPPCYLKFLIAVSTSSIVSSSTSTSLIFLFPILINSFGSCVFSNLSKYSFHISALSFKPYET